MATWRPLDVPSNEYFHKWMSYNIKYSLKLLQSHILQINISCNQLKIDRITNVINFKSKNTLINNNFFVRLVLVFLNMNKLSRNFF